MFMNNNLLYKVALSMVPGIGDSLARNLVAYVGSVEGVFKEPASRLKKIPGIGDVYADRIKNNEILATATAEIEFSQKHGIDIYFYLDENYPARFKHCPDAPVVFYRKGNADLDSPRAISIVGTRNATEYGRQVTDDFIRNLAAKHPQLLIVSGLAYGIDIQAHKSALKYNLPTVGVLGHGLDKLYPSAHLKTARLMVENGALVSDFPSKSKIDPANFIKRNRMIAGLADATIVVESGEKGGALITADIAMSYHRDVFAFPGRTTDQFSKGCNRLIKTNAAALIENAADFEYLMGWEPTSRKTPRQSQLFVELTDEEKVVVEVLRKEEKMFIDTICHEAKIAMNRTSALLLNLEFKGVVDALPGKMYRLK